MNTMDKAPATAGQDSDQVMDMLEEHVPLSLIMDLAAPLGPNSHDILSTEGAPDDTGWMRP